ncbi:outer membrane beta-barrel protein [Bradyrhizobium sp. CCGB12]|uniref:outer membrane protein n=1 Tax=Bradyrhizobium sp. CCGB12 TaxID=2949632 RepID=UPI0020B2E893|nr:outer membrane beta-barrel protein [Bradyrhizobium sp. CCGB12]MCP3393696.1 outer membrane beta-barrel protein [Bradyrhizobium sp. CCGB12]
MQQIAKLAAIFFVASVIPAFAADVPAKTPSSIAAPVASWTGFYAGLNAGYGWSDATSSNVAVDPASALLFAVVLPPGSFDTRFAQEGAMAGGQAGVNWQLSDRFVAGIEADIQWSDIHGSDIRSAATAIPNLQFTSNTTRNLEWFGTVRARLGFLATPDLLLYGTGGLAYGQTNTSASIGLTPPPGINVATGFSDPSGNFTFACSNAPGSPPNCYSGSSRQTSVGWSAGLGGEWRFADRWTAKLEWLHIDLPGNSVTLVSPSPPSSPGVMTKYNFVHQGYDFVRVGLNYQFSGGAVAKH